VPDSVDRRSKVVRLTRQARRGCAPRARAWTGSAEEIREILRRPETPAQMRALLHAVTETELDD